MYYFFVTISYHHNNNIVSFSTAIKSIEYPTKIEIIEAAFIADSDNHLYLGLNGLGAAVHDSKTKITAYSTLTELQYVKYKYG